MGNQSAECGGWEILTVNCVHAAASAATSRRRFRYRPANGDRMESVCVSVSVSPPESSGSGCRGTGLSLASVAFKPSSAPLSPESPPPPALVEPGASAATLCVGRVPRRARVATASVKEKGQSLPSRVWVYFVTCISK